MPRYAPLPSVELDPRSEAELVQAATQKVYEASGATINDFSSGSPIVALLEGQAFAQSEFLQFANQFPESVLVEWIGPFLGAQRRTGAGAVVQVTFTIDPRDDQFDVFAGYQLATDANKTGGESIAFVTTERLIIPPGQIQGTVSAISVFRGEQANVDPGTIIKSVTSLAGVTSVINADKAAGGQDPELLTEVKERFFSLIRRRNPVSAEDWEDFFSDALGPGTSTVVLPRRSEKNTYRYEENYVTANPSVSFFVLNPDGSPITKAQQDALENLLRWSLPTEFLGFVYPMEVDDVDFVLDIKYDAAKPYAQNLADLAQQIRDNAFGVMTPNAVFPINYDQTVNDVESALTTSFPLTLGTSNQYIDPDISSIKAYDSPEQISVSAFTQVSPKEFSDDGYAIAKGDLIIEQGNISDTYYEVLKGFEPVTNTKTYHVNVGDLDVEIIRELKIGPYDVGDVISYGTDGKLYVVIASFIYEERETLDSLIAKGFLSPEKSFSNWVEGDSYSNLNATTGVYDPQLVVFDQADTRFVTYYPTLPTTMSKSRRPGSPIYVVEKSFTLGVNTTKLGTVQSEGYVSKSVTPVKLLVDGQTYATGDYVKTPNPQEFTSQQLLTEFCYIDAATGAKELYAKVVTGFTFVVPARQTYDAAVDGAIADGTLQIVEIVPFITCAGLSVFSEKPFRYTARFRTGEYIQYRALGGEISNVVPTYYFVLKDFTPNTTNIDKLIEDECIELTNVDIFSSTYTCTIPLTTYKVYSATITNQLVVDGTITSEAVLVTGETCQVYDEYGTSRGLWNWTGSQWLTHQPSLPTWRDMFRFAPGDVVSFRSVSDTRSYVALEHVTPLLEIETYYDNGVFASSDKTANVQWIDPAYHLEDVIVNEVNGAESFYRAIRSFTPPAVQTVWNDSVVPNTPRIEELFGNDLKFVTLSTCQESITSRLRDGASSVKLGTCQINLTSKALGSATSTYVWESTPYSTVTPALSDWPQSTWPYGPVDYGTGTLAL